MGWLKKILTILSRPSPPPAPPPASPDAASRLAELLALHNEARRGLVPLVRHPLLEWAALEHAMDVAHRQVLGDMHRGSDGSDVAQRVRHQGYPFLLIEENAQMFPGDWPGEVSPASAMKTWMDSPGHRRNILNPAIREAGFGVAAGPGGQTIWIAVFGTRPS